MLQITKEVREFVFEDERPFNNCHASTVVALPRGDLLVSYFGGTKEKHPDVAIWCSRRTAGVWSPPYKVADEADIAHWNPVLFRKDDGQILLHYKVGRTVPEWHTRVTVSDDDGATWSEPKELVPGDIGGRGPVKNKLIRLQDGTWIAPASLESTVWDAFADISRDEGLTWSASSLVPIVHEGQEEPAAPSGDDFSERLETVTGRGLIQPTVWESQPGHVHMLMRSSSGSIYRSDSADSGRTWSPARRTHLPNNNSGIDLAKLDNGTLVLAYNPVGMYKGPRTPLLLSYSEDNGDNWRQLKVLEGEYLGFSYPPPEFGEYSYPAVIAEGNRIYVTYTWKRVRIVCWSMEVELD